MTEISHRYYCPHCKRFFYGDGTHELARTVNGHNDRFHPAEFAGWIGQTIVKSAHYRGPAEPLNAEPPRPDTKSEADSPLPALTAFDKKFLAKGLIKW
jgi:hypothetical protein